MLLRTGLTLLGALLAAVLCDALGTPIPWMLGPLLCTACASMAGLATRSSGRLRNLGVRFERQFLQTAPRWLFSVALGTLVMLAASALLGWGPSRLVGQHPATLILGTSPGGIAEMAITAKVLQLGVPVVTAFQVCRLVAVLLLVGPVYDQLEKKGHLS